ncbi:MAG: ribonucleotide-diphosphate reductase subunit beta [Thermoleophilaceae bacterium]|nr:ribonucleotide-diphosphate reductase subunit beta [Thermoleophilaceae bacterium]
MATLLDLAAQGDVATVEDESRLSSIKLMTPQQLYELWERQPWSAHALDLTRDREDWASFDDDERADMIWGLSSFFVGEERVTTQFSGLVMSYEDQSEEAYLTTQQVDEARHTQLFARLYDEVMDVGGGIDAQLERVRADLNDSFVKLFDEHLVEAGRRLIEDPSSVEAKVDFVTTYHMVIEGTLALTGQNFITDFFEKTGKMPGFVEGFKKVSQDEHRHVAYGTWYLQKAVCERPELARRVQDKLAELLPVAAGVLVPAGKDPFGEWDLLGYPSEQINRFAFTALSRRLKVIGVGLPAVAA